MNWIDIAPPKAINSSLCVAARRRAINPRLFPGKAGIIPWEMLVDEIFTEDELLANGYEKQWDGSFKKKIAS